MHNHFFSFLRNCTVSCVPHFLKVLAKLEQCFQVKSDMLFRVFIAALLLYKYTRLTKWIDKVKIVLVNQTFGCVCIKGCFHIYYFFKKTNSALLKVKQQKQDSVIVVDY